MEEREFDAGAVTINFAEGPPAGPPLVLLHGGSARWQGWGDVLTDFAASFHVYAPDLRGHGKSGRVPGRYLLQDYAADIIAFLREVVEAPAHMFGCSLGGQVALMVAAQWGEGVRAVVVGDSPLERQVKQSGSDAPWRARVAAWRDLAGGRLSIEEIVDALKDTLTEVPGQAKSVTMREKHGDDSSFFIWLATNLYHNDPDMLTAVLEGHFGAGYEMEALFPAIRCPVLLLQADPAAGGMMTDAEVAQAVRLLPSVKHVRLQNTGHNIFFPDGELALRAAAEFLGSV